jgi:hypothetical protein
MFENLYRTRFFGQQFEWMNVIDKESKILACITSDPLPMTDHPEGRTPIIKVVCSESNARACKRSITTFTEKIKKAIHQKKRFIWVPIRLKKPNTLHANALWIDVRGLELHVWHFEPYGCIQIGLEETLLEYLKIALQDFTDFQFYAANNWMPEKFIQSVLKDEFCAMHCFQFLVESTKTSPRAFVKKLTENEYTYKATFEDLGQFMKEEWKFLEQ